MSRLDEHHSTVAEAAPGARGGERTTVGPVVCLSFPGIERATDLGRITTAHPDVDVLVVPYEDPRDLRTAKRRTPHDPGIRSQAPALTDEQRDALTRAEVLVTLDTPFDLPDHAPNLRWVQGIGSGVTHLAACGLPRDGITVTNAAGIGSDAIAEFVLARLLMFWKRFPELDAQQQRHQWKDCHGTLVRGKTVGVVGLGAIGRSVAERARAFGMEVLGIRRSYRPDMDSPVADELFGPDALHEVLGRSDAVVISASDSPDTADMIDRAAFAAMKPGAIFCNVARGTLVDEKALVEALESGHLAGAATDVTRQEPLPEDSPLWDVPNLFISPHSSASADGYFDMVLDLFLENLGRYVAGEPLVNTVDLTTGM